MNYRLSCAVNRVLKKNCYVLELNGRRVSGKVFKFEGDNIKENILETVYQGIKMARVYVKHEDILFIEIQNVHLCEWLNGMKEYSGYETGLDKVFDVLESTDCRYKFSFIRRPYAMVYLEKHDITEMTGSSFASIMKELENSPED